ncbi:MAG: lipopolysaccharide core heptose(I) kinase RfaP, partial [Desulfuromonadales bacterium]|nr:lipopolysaccharide core heptose(I) kinase RfaP [Desulfuromonadales bacterium]
MFELDSAIASHFQGEDAFEQILKLEGEAYRNFANRRTLRVELDGAGYFCKIHLGVGWKEIFKCLFSFRLPVLGALHEWRAIRRLEELDVDTMKIAGVGCRGANPADQQSFLITEELAGTVSLEDFCQDWLINPPPLALKRALIEKIAVMARQLHQNGVNHRDFYLCHFHLNLASVDHFLSGQASTIKLHLIDLHRTQVR